MPGLSINDTWRGVKKPFMNVVCGKTEYWKVYYIEKRQ